MTGGDGRKPLWASGLADQPRADFDDVVVRVVEDEPEEDARPQPPRPERPPGRGRVPAWVAIPAVVVFGLAIAFEGRGSMRIDEVPSFWGDVPMTCDTVRLARGDRAVERFTCRAVGDGRLPPGLYRSPDARWSSDFTGRPARSSRIRISRDGEVTGWATY